MAGALPNLVVALVPFLTGHPAASIREPVRADLRTELRDTDLWLGVEAQVLKAAIGEAPAQGGGSPPTFRSRQLERFDQLVREAEVPDCLHKDALKRQPPRILFIEFKDLYAVPFIFLAKYRGKCK